MSDHLSERAVGSFSGYVTVSEKTTRGMLTVRGDLRSSKFKNAFVNAVGAKLPNEGKVIFAESTVAWMSPDELLIIVPKAERNAAFAALEQALEGRHYLLADVSDARACFTIEGGSAREVVAKLSPMDLSAAQFPVGGFARTRFAQVAGAIFVEQEDRLSLVCFRSVQDYVFSLLCGAAKLGSEVRAQS